MIISMIQNKGGSDRKSISSAVITLDSNILTYNGQVQYKNVISVVLGGTTLIEGTDYIVEDNFAINVGSHTLNVVGIGSYSGVATASWNIAKATATISIDKNNIELSGGNPSETITVTTNSDGNISATSSDTEVCTVSVNGSSVIVAFEGVGNASISIQLLSSDNFIASEIVSCNVECIRNVYGVSWDKTSTTLLTRTDESANFTDPIPCLSGGTGSSPFDTLYPWNGMVKETFEDGNVMVKIPKFWYKWTDETNSLKLQVADGPADGFHVSPAHADRGDGKGERDYVYIGRYHCNSSYKSVSGATPVASITRATARTGCQGVGTGYYQLDYAMWWTVRMLYLVEFADWNSQAKIGYGCGNGSATEISGSSDNAQYHTGSMKSSRATYGVGVQYRHIEDPWANIRDWCDGIVLSSGAAYVTNDMSKYEDTTSNHTKVGDAPAGSGCISEWTIPSISGLEWALWVKSKASDNNYATYVADYVDISYVCLTVGGLYNNQQGAGMFYAFSHSTSAASGSIGARLQYLP